MKYFQNNLITIYLGDCRDIMPCIKNKYSCILTDPVWTNSPLDMFPGIDPIELFRTAAAFFPALSDRLIIHLGIDTDPRMLIAIPASYQFLRVCWLRYAFPNPKGRILYSGDIAYIYGPPPDRLPPGKKILPGETVGTEKNIKNGHPCPRKLSHVKWLIHWFTSIGPVLDPFAGSGTTLLAAAELGIKSVGIEIEEKYAEIAAKRANNFNNIPFNYYL